MKLPIRLDRTTLALILANLFTILLAVIFNWSFQRVFWVYWWQSAIIGFFHFFKIRDLRDFSTEGISLPFSGGKQAQENEETKKFAALWFAIIFGGSMLCFAAFMIFLSAFGSIKAALVGSSAIESQDGGLIDFLMTLAAIAVFFITHLSAYRFYKNKPTKRRNILDVTWGGGLWRIVPMQLAIILFFFLSFYFVSTSLVLVFFLLIKTAVDVITHNFEHAWQWQPEGNI